MTRDVRLCFDSALKLESLSPPLDVAIASVLFDWVVGETLFIVLVAESSLLFFFPSCYE